MKKTPNHFYVTILLMLNAALFPEVMHAGDDVQLWLNIDAGGVMTESLTLNVKQGLRWKGDAGTLSTHFADFGVQHRTAPWLTTGAFYRQQYDKIGDNGAWIVEKRPFMDATVHWLWRGIQFSDRNRIEYRDRDRRNDEFRYRNKLMQRYQAKITHWSLQPYTAQEIFVDEGPDERAETSRVRFFVGLKGDPAERFLFLGHKPEGTSFRSDWYLMYESQEIEDERVNTFVIGMKFGVFF